MDLDLPRVSRSCLVWGYRGIIVARVGFASGGSKFVRLKDLDVEGLERRGTGIMRVRRGEDRSDVRGMYRHYMAKPRASSKSHRGDDVEQLLQGIVRFLHRFLLRKIVAVVGVCTPTTPLPSTTPSTDGRSRSAQVGVAGDMVHGSNGREIYPPFNRHAFPTRSILAS